jgi:hypothetical protein
MPERSPPIAIAESSLDFNRFQLKDRRLGTMWMLLKVAE